MVVINTNTNNMQANIRILPCQQALPQPDQAAGQNVLHSISYPD